MKLSSLKKEKFIVLMRRQTTSTRSTTSSRKITGTKSDLRETHEKNLNEMEEKKRFQGFIFDTIPRRRLMADRDTILPVSKSRFGDPFPATRRRLCAHRQQRVQRNLPKNRVGEGKASGNCLPMASRLDWWRAHHSEEDPWSAQPCRSDDQVLERREDHQRHGETSFYSEKRAHQHCWWLVAAMFCAWRPRCGQRNRKTLSSVPCSGCFVAHC